MPELAARCDLEDVDLRKPALKMVNMMYVRLRACTGLSLHSCLSAVSPYQPMDTIAMGKLREARHQRCQPCI